MDDEQPLTGGNVTPVVRVGDTVRRPVGPWTSNVHALLNHLRRHGVDIVPKVHGRDSTDREVLSYIPGQAGVYPDGWPFTDDECLVGVGETLRQLHDASRDFLPPNDGWRYQVDAPRTGDVICHNDFAPYNCVFDNGEIVGVIDWDFAAPAPPEWDLVHALWRFTPLYPPATWWLGNHEPFPISRSARRMRLLCHGYGTVLTSGLVDLLERREFVVARTAITWRLAEVPGFENMLPETPTEKEFEDLTHLRAIRNQLDSEISTSPG